MQAKSARHGWADLAKAVCILLVVFYHARQQVHLIHWTNPGIAMAFWWHSGSILRPLRMPLFFTISGLLAAPSLDRPWSDIARKRVGNILYLYAIWGAAFLLLLPQWWILGPLAGATSSQVGLFFLGISPAWYLFALAAFFVFARLTRSLPWWIVIGFGLILALAAFERDDIIEDQHQLMMRCLVFYLLAIRLPELPSAVAALTQRKWLAVAALLLVLALAMDRVAGFRTKLLEDLAAVLFGCIAASQATRHWPHLGTFGRWLGERTLAVYVMHYFVLAASISLSALLLPQTALDSALLALAYPPLISVVAVAICLAAHEYLVRNGVGWLFKAPVPRGGPTLKPSAS